MQKLFLGLCLFVLMVIGITNGIRSVTAESLYFGGPIMNGNIAIGNGVLGFNLNTRFMITTNYQSTNYPNGSTTFATDCQPFAITFISSSSTQNFTTPGSGGLATIKSGAWVCD